MRRRRRPFRRPLMGRALARATTGRGLRSPALSEKVHRELRRANQLTENGDHLNAAAIFVRLAEAAHDRGILRHAPMLYLQAASANVLGGEIDTGLALAKQGLGILADSGQYPRLKVAGKRAVAVLQDSGFSDRAGELQRWLESALSGQDGSSPSIQPRSHRLPPKCPYCGAAVRSDEVEWIDPQTAECVYCGSSIASIE